MAEKRMFSKAVTRNDTFMDMPLTTQALYFHLGMEADDDGFLSNAKVIQRMIGASEDDLKLLFAKGFLIHLGDGNVCVIRHWKQNNQIKKDRYHETIYLQEKAMLRIDENNTYQIALEPECIQDVSKMDTQYRIEEERVVKESIKSNSSEPETVSEPAIITLTLNDGTEYPVSQTDIDNWESLYPAVDIMQALRNMKGWCEANPTKRKTKRGIAKFINSWLSREQDRGRKKEFSAYMDGYRPDQIEFLKRCGVEVE